MTEMGSKGGDTKRHRSRRSGQGRRHARRHRGWNRWAITGAGLASFAALGSCFGMLLGNYTVAGMVEPGSNGRDTAGAERATEIDNANQPKIADVEQDEPAYLDGIYTNDADIMPLNGR